MKQHFKIFSSNCILISHFIIFFIFLFIIFFCLLRIISCQKSVLPLPAYVIFLVKISTLIPLTPNLCPGNVCLESDRNLSWWIHCVLKQVRVHNNLRWYLQY